MGVDAARDVLAERERGEGSAQGDQELAVGLDLGLGGRGDDHRTQQQDHEQEALHQSLQSGVTSRETGHSNLS